MEISKMKTHACVIKFVIWGTSASLSICHGHINCLVFNVSHVMSGHPLLFFIHNWYILACGPEPVKLTKAEGKFTHLYYYDTNERCLWRISVKNGSHVKLHIQIIDIHSTDVIRVRTSFKYHLMYFWFYYIKKFLFFTFKTNIIWNGAV